MSTPLSFFVATLTAALLAARAAAAQPSHGDQVAADALFTSAKDAMDRGEYASACPKLVESQRLDPAPGTLLNLGECEAHLGQLRAAISAFEHAKGQLPAGDFRTGFAESRIAALRARLARLSVRVEGASGAGAGAHVACDGTEAPIGTPLTVDPGPHVCILRASGQPEIRSEATLHDGEQQTLVLRVAPQPGPTARPLAAPLAARDPARSHAPGSAQRAWGLVVGGVGAAGLAFGGVMALVAKNTYGGAIAQCDGGPDACPPAAVQDGATAHTQATIATWAMAGGGALLAAGGVLYLAAPRSGILVAPRAGSNFCGIEMKGSF